MPACAVSLPPGSIGIAFVGKEPVVSRVKEDSPLRGVVKMGFTFKSLTYGDGTTIEGLDSHSLVGALTESSNDSNRTIKLDMTLPKSSTVNLAAGPHFLTIEDKMGRATITGINRASPLKDELRVGMNINKLCLEDGYELHAPTAYEASEALDTAQNDSKRTLMLISPSSQAAPRKTVLPGSAKVALPPGSTRDLGILFTGEIARVQSVSTSSPLSGVRPQYMVERFVCNGNYYEGQSSSDIRKLIDGTSGEHGRELILRNPSSYAAPNEATSTIMLPSVGTVSDLGVNFVGQTARVNSVSASSPLAGLVLKGHVVKTFGWSEGTSFDALSALELKEAIDDSSGVDGRYIVTSNGIAAGDSVIMFEAPPGPLKATFKNNPPKLATIKPGSSLEGKVPSGMVADVLYINGEPHHEMDTMGFTSLLKQSVNENRVIRFIDPTSESVTPTPNGPLGIVDYKALTLPKGKIGVKFRGSQRAVVSSVNPTSALKGSLPVGMTVDTINAGNQTHMELGAKAVASIIQATSQEAGRVMVVRAPDSAEFQVVPTYLEVPLFPGRLGCTFRGNPPSAKSFKPESQLSQHVPPYMFVDEVKTNNGYSLKGFHSTKELVEKLGFMSNRDDRVLVFKKVGTPPSPREETFPEEVAVPLPTSKVGISLKGGKKAYISRVHPDSKVTGLAYVRMRVDKIIVPGPEGTTEFTGMTAKEAARVLVDTKTVGGRVMILKAPGSKMSIRNLPESDAISTTSSQMTSAWSLGSNMSGRSVRVG